MRYVGADELRAFAQDVLAAAGVAGIDAEVIAEALVDANLGGVDSHGVLRLIQYADALRDGQVNARPEVRIVRRGIATGLVDADGGYGYRPTLLAADLALELAAAAGAAVVGVAASHHFGVTAYYALRLARAGAIGIVTTNTSPVLAPPGSSQPIVGNNPIAIAAPRPAPHDPIVADIALSEVAYGKIRLAAAEGRPIPLGWGRDAQGQPTTDAVAALAAHSLEPVGRHKGFALATMVEVLAGALTGSPVGLRSNPHENDRGGVGHLVVAIRPESFTDLSVFDGHVEELVDSIHAAERADSTDRLYLPGEIERITREQRTMQGIPLTDELTSQLSSLAARLETVVPRWASDA